MGKFVDRSWPADPAAPGGRKARAAFRYKAFIPVELTSLDLRLPAGLAERLNRAERSLVDLNRDPPALGSLEVLARRLLRSESVASSRIEGLELSQRRLAKAEAAGHESRDESAKSVLANIRAMEKAIEIADKRQRITSRDVCTIYGTLMQFGPTESPRLRAEQNWIGGSSFNPHDADFVPPPPEEVPRLMEDLCHFLARTDLPPIAQAAIVHAQFETIHPFPDGNGRVGRALIHVVLRRRGLAPAYVPPISLVLAGSSKAYIRGLTDFREGDTEAWLERFASAAKAASEQALKLAARFQALRNEWTHRANYPRSDSSAAAIIAALPAYPILNVATAQAVTKRSKQAVNEAMAALEAAGILKQTSVARRNRGWEAREVFEILDNFERQLATPLDGSVGDRRAPYPGRGHSRS